MTRLASTPDTSCPIAQLMGSVGISMVLAGLVLATVWIVRSGCASTAQVANAPVAPARSSPMLMNDGAILHAAVDSMRSSAKERTSDADSFDPGIGDDTTRGARLPRKESDFHSRFLGLSPEILAAEAERVVAGDSTRAERVALLRALLDRGHPRTLEAFLECVETPPTLGASGLEPLPATLVHLLRQRARRDPLARQILEAIAWRSAAPPAVRARAAAMAVAHADEADLRRLQDAILLEPEPALRAAVSSALRARPGTLHASWLGERLAVPEPAPAPVEPTLE